MANRGDYDELVAHCIRQAQLTEAPEKRAFLLMMAQAWLKLGARAEESRSHLPRIEQIEQ
jgi:hypothetical protein